MTSWCLQTHLKNNSQIENLPQLGVNMRTHIYVYIYTDTRMYTVQICLKPSPR